MLATTPDPKFLPCPLSGLSILCGRPCSHSQWTLTGAHSTESSAPQERSGWRCSGPRALLSWPWALPSGVSQGLGMRGLPPATHMVPVTGADWQFSPASLYVAQGSRSWLGKHLPKMRAIVGGIRHQHSWNPLLPYFPRNMALFTAFSSHRGTWSHDAFPSTLDINFSSGPLHLDSLE